MRKHIISLYAIAVILLASQVFVMYTLIIRTSQLSEYVNSTYGELKDKIDENQQQNQAQIKELTTTLMATQKDVEKQISEIKATTSADFSGIIEQSLQSVVSVGTDISQGSGFIISEDGLVVTNAHVLSGARYAKVLTYSREIKNAKLIGYNLDMDVAVLKIQGNFAALDFGNSDNVKVGEKVIAVGNPLGLSFSVTEGIVSATHRIGPNNLPTYIQTDVPLNPGNSGGPLIDKQGKVIGITNFKIGGYESIGFALESNYIVNTVNEITNQTFITS